MARHEVVRRVKSYSSLATGHVYQYYFMEMNRVQRGTSRGTEYIYRVSADRQAAYALRVFVEGTAVEDWNRRAGRKLAGTEEYALAKMRLFQAFDELPELAGAPGEEKPQLRVDETNLDALLEALGI
jgi:hypothetical protein